MDGIAKSGEETNVNHHIGTMKQKPGISTVGGQDTNVTNCLPHQPEASSARSLTHDLRVRPPVLLDERELSYVARISSRSIRNYVRAGILPRIKIGRRVLFRWPQVEAALAKLEGGAK